MKQKKKDFRDIFAEMLIEDIKKGNYIVKDGDLYLKGVNDEIRITRRKK